MAAFLLSNFVADEEIIELLQRLVRIDSSNPPAVEEPVAQAIADVCAAAGLEASVDSFAPGRANVLVRYRGNGRKPALLLSGHLDTVPAGQTGWDHPPHSAAVRDGIVYGRGTVDMKGAVAAMTAACIGAARARLALAGNVLFAGTAGEEVDSAGARRLLTQSIEPVGEIVVGEPTRLDVAPAHKGALWVEIETTGVAAHGAMPEQGRNAIAIMRGVMQALDGFRTGMPPHALLGLPTLNMGTIHGGIKPNMVPDRCALTLDIRTLPGERHSDIVDQLRSLLGDVAIRILNSMPAVETPVESALIRSGLDVMCGLRGRAPNIRGMSYYSDASVLSPGLNAPALICGPGDERLAHQANERISLEEVLAAARFYFELIQVRLAD
jgi:succinyl-diaminopimelate desuccinylase